MTEQQSNRPPLSPLEQLANVCDAICADDFFNEQAQMDEDPVWVTDVARAAIKEALLRAPASRSSAEMPSGKARVGETPPKYSMGNPGARTSRDSLARGLFRAWGVHPVLFLLLVIANLVLFAIDWATAGAGLVFDIPIVPIVGIIVFVVQKKVYGDGKTAALIKACVLTTLTVIPIPSLPVLFFPARMAGLVRRTAKTEAEFAGGERSRRR